MSPAELPTVTCVITAYNHERFVCEAVRSALAQDYPPELLDVVLVNDGSSDATEQVLEQHFGSEGRVRLIHQTNSGFVAAINTALAAAGGELIGILDGDDAWPAGRISAQVELLLERPQVGLVHGDMEIVDVDGHTLHPSFFAYSGFTVERGRVLAQLIRQNFVAGGATLVRSSLRPRFLPIPEELIYPDWYIAARVAECAEIDHVEVCANRYRMHTANMGLGGTGVKFFSDMRNNARIQRWMLCHLDTSAAPLGELLRAHETMRANASRASLELQTLPSELLGVEPAERTRAAELAAGAAQAIACGDGEEACRTWLSALAIDPWNGSALADLAVALARLERAHSSPPGTGLPAAPATRASAIVAFADELIERPEMLVAYAGAVDGSTDATLLIHAPAGEAEAAAEGLQQALAGAGLDGPDAADLLLYPCDDVAQLLAAPVRAVYSRRAKPGALATLPLLDDTGLARLGELLSAQLIST